MNTKCELLAAVRYGHWELAARNTFKALAAVAQLEDFRLKAFNEGYQAGSEDAWREASDFFQDDIV